MNLMLMWHPEDPQNASLHWDALSETINTK